jgi:hypothetical protein
MPADTYDLDQARFWARFADEKVLTRKLQLHDLLYDAGQDPFQ